MLYTAIEIHPQVRLDRELITKRLSRNGSLKRSFPVLTSLFPITTPSLHDANKNTKGYLFLPLLVIRLHRLTLGSVALMTLVQGRAVSLSSSDPIKMEERKRPASHDHDGSEPPLKRHATSVNGAPKSHIDADMPWKDDLEVGKPYHLSCPFSLPKRSQRPPRTS